MKTFDIEVLNAIVETVDVSANVVYDSTSVYGFEKAVNLEAKYQLYSNLSNASEYLGLSKTMVVNLVDRLYELNKELFLDQACNSFDQEYA